MNLIPEEPFHALLRTRGIAADARYPDARCLSYKRSPGDSRFWTRPDNPARWPHFVESLLSGIDAWTSGTIWPRCGRWPRESEATSINERVIHVVLRGIGVPDGWPGAAQFEHTEIDKITAVIFTYLAFAWCVEHDLYFLPDHGRQFLLTDHHDVIHVECADAERVGPLVEHMANAGYELPTELPDWTFIRPSWMPDLADDPES